jgi:hypothetical protein
VANVGGVFRHPDRSLEQVRRRSSRTGFTTISISTTGIAVQVLDDEQSRRRRDRGAFSTSLAGTGDAE